MGKQDFIEKLSGRFLEFAAEVVKLVSKLGKFPETRHIANQLIRSSTSTGANYEEACGAESRSDFLHKMQVVLKELKESLYWLRLIKKAELPIENGEQFKKILQEAQELTNIIAKSVVTAKNNRKS